MFVTLLAIFSTSQKTLVIAECFTSLSMLFSLLARSSLGGVGDKWGKHGQKALLLLFSLRTDSHSLRYFVQRKIREISLLNDWEFLFSGVLHLLAHLKVAVFNQVPSVRCSGSPDLWSHENSWCWRLWRSRLFRMVQARLRMALLLTPITVLNTSLALMSQREVGHSTDARIQLILCLFLRLSFRLDYDQAAIATAYV